MNLNSKIYVAGHRGLVGSALVRMLLSQGFDNLLTVPHSQIDLCDPVAVKWLFSVHKPEYVFLCAAKVGGIFDNREHPLDFFIKNYGVKKLVFLGSSCAYPPGCPQPIKEEYLLSGPFQEEVEAYGLAKVCGVRLCQWYRKVRGRNFVSAMPCNLYGVGDNFDPKTAHCVPALLARMHRAKTKGEPHFFVWGDGTQRRELLFADDLAEALLLVMEKYDGAEPINTGSGYEITIQDLAVQIARTVKYSGLIRFDPEAPTGTMRKLLDNSKIFSLGWTPRTPFDAALRLTYQDFCGKVGA